MRRPAGVCRAAHGKFLVCLAIGIIIWPAPFLLLYGPSRIVYKKRNKGGLCDYTCKKLPQIIEVLSIHASLRGSNFSFCRDVGCYLSVRLYSLQRRSPHKHGSLHCIIQLPYFVSTSGHLGILLLSFGVLFCFSCCFSEIMLFSLVHFKSSF